MIWPSYSLRLWYLTGIAFVSQNLAWEICDTSMFTCYMTMISYFNIWFRIKFTLYKFHFLYSLQVFLKVFFHNFFTILYKTYHHYIKFCNHNYKQYALDIHQHLYHIVLFISCITIISIKILISFQIKFSVFINHRRILQLLIIVTKLCNTNFFRNMNALFITNFEAKLFIICQYSRFDTTL